MQVVVAAHVAELARRRRAGSAAKTSSSGCRRPKRKPARQDADHRVGMSSMVTVEPRMCGSPESTSCHASLVRMTTWFLPSGWSSPGAKPRPSARRDAEDVEEVRGGGEAVELLAARRARSGRRRRRGRPPICAEARVPARAVDEVGLARSDAAVAALARDGRPSTIASGSPGRAAAGGAPRRRR